AEALSARAARKLINIGDSAFFLLGARDVSGYTQAVPVDPKTLPKDTETLRKIVVDLTAQLDRTERLLRQLIQAKTGRKSEQLSREQLALFAAEAGLVIPELELAEQDEESDDPPPGATGENKPRG